MLRRTILGWAVMLATLGAGLALPDDAEAACCRQRGCGQRRCFAARTCRVRSSCCGRSACGGSYACGTACNTGCGTAGACNAPVYNTAPNPDGTMPAPPSALGY